MRGCVRPSVRLFFFSRSFVGCMWPCYRHFSAFVSLLRPKFPLPIPVIHIIFLVATSLPRSFSLSGQTFTPGQICSPPICSESESTIPLWKRLPSVFSLCILAPSNLRPSLITHKYSFHFR